MTPGEAGQLVASLIMLGAFFYFWNPIVGILNKLKTRREFRGHLESERRRVRLEKLCDLADEFDASDTDSERRRVFIKATAMGFTDGPFMLDENEQPHKPAA